MARLSIALQETVGSASTDQHSRRDAASLSVCSESRQVAIDLLLLPGFDLGDLAAIADALSAANRFLDQALFRWRLVTNSGAPVLSSAGLVIRPDTLMRDVAESENIIVLSGDDDSPVLDFALYGWLCQQADQAGSIGALGQGVSVLARAGLLAGRKACAHWAAHGRWQARYSDVTFESRLFSMAHGVLTCAGGEASLDLALQLVSIHAGRHVSRSIADQFNLQRLRLANDTQGPISALALGQRNPILRRAIEEIHNNVEPPISLSELARRVHATPRRLQRLFKRYLETTPARYYLLRRLDRAWLLLHVSSTAISSVARATGFASSSHFTRLYRAHFGGCPSHDRRSC